MKKKRLKKKNILIILILLIIILNIVFYNLFLKNKLKLLGSWTTENTTIYEFYKNNTGKLIVSLHEYEFNYKLKDSNLYIDFVNDTLEDSEYKYSFNGKKLILSNNKGVFTFSKK